LEALLEDGSVEGIGQNHKAASIVHHGLHFE
jgi:hypothetical protein